jgi:heme A synthase
VWRPSRLRTAATAGAALVALALALTASGGPLGLDGGIAFLVLAAVGLTVAALDLWFGAALRADDEGLIVRSGPRREERIHWSEVTAVEATTTTSRGLLRLGSLEIEIGERLVLLSRYRLASDPAGVADDLRRRWRNARP